MSIETDVTIDVTDREEMPGQPGLARLAAVHAALDQERDYCRADILVAIVIECLAEGALTTDGLRDRVNTLWATHAVTGPMLERAILVAQQLSLVEQRIGLDGEVRWGLTEATLDDARKDRAWVHDVVSNFESELNARLTALCGVRLAPQQVASITNKLICGLVDAVEGAYRVVGDLRDLRPPHIDGTRVITTMKQRRVYDCLSKDVRSIIAEELPNLVAAVLDHDDQLGNDVIHLLTVGNILQGLLASASSAVPMVAGTRIALDTSALVPLVARGTAAARLLGELIERTTALGGDVLVFEHTIEEYERLWLAADVEVKSTEGWDRLVEWLAEIPDSVQNPFVSEYLRLRGIGENLTWERFCIGRRNIRPFLEQRGVKIIDAAVANQDRITVVEDELVRLSADSSVRGHRSRQAARADATTCAAIIEWRSEQPGDPPRAWFVANDSLTQQAFATLTDDPYPLVASPEAWLMYLSLLGDGDPTAVQGLANTLGDVTTRRSVLAVASTFTLEDAVRFGRMLKTGDGDGLAPTELRRAVQLDLAELLDQAADPDRKERDVRDFADRVLRDRWRRRGEQAKRDRAEAEAVRQDIDSTVGEAIDTVLTDERARHEAELARTREQNDAALRTLSAEKDAETDARVAEVNSRRSQDRRVMACGVVAVALVLANAFFLPGRAGWLQVFVIAISVVLVGFAVKWVRDRAPVWWIAVEAGMAAALLLAEVAAGQLVPFG